jgi:hypothetical protein
LPDRRRLPQQEIGAFPLELLDQPADRHLRWDRQATRARDSAEMCPCRMSTHCRGSIPRAPPPEPIRLPTSR